MNIYRFLTEDFDQLPTENEDFIHKLADQKILITGATGFFGKWLLFYMIYLNRCKKINFEIFAISRDSAVFLSKYPEINECTFIKWHNHDLKYPISLDFEPGLVFHLATEVASSKDSINTHSFDAILLGMKNVLNFLKDKNSNSKLILASSGGAYGLQPNELKNLDENFNGAPNTLNVQAYYGEAKRVCEIMCTLHKQDQINFDFVIARCFAFSGPFLPLDHRYAIGNLVKNFIEEKPLTINGTGEDKRSYLYGADLAFWLLKILVQGKSSEIYNVGSSEEVSIKELASLVNDFNAKDIIVKKNINISPTRYVPSVFKANRELGLYNNFSLKYSIDRMINFNRDYKNV